jgi:hypothetical protein
MTKLEEVPEEARTTVEEHLKAILERSKAVEEIRTLVEKEMQDFL